MLAEPADLAADVVLDVVRQHWDAGAFTIAYLPRGAGAYHWVVSGRHRPRWFVTADPLPDDTRLADRLDAYAAARGLAAAGHHVVVPTLPPVDDPNAVGVVVGAYLVTVTSYLEGASGPGPYADDNQRALLAGALGGLHAAAPPDRLRDWVPGPPRRHELAEALGDLDRPWGSGPCADTARAALRACRAELVRLLERYDRLAAAAVARRETWVPTHGEPHTANVLWLPGGPVLVDWESLRRAPRERDLRTVLRDADGAEPLSAYVAHGGTADLDADLVELFDLEWWLWEMGEHAVRFRSPHPGDADDERFLAALLDEAVPAVDIAAGTLPDR